MVFKLLQNFSIITDLTGQPPIYLSNQTPLGENKTQTAFKGCGVKRNTTCLAQCVDLWTEIRKKVFFSLQVWLISIRETRKEQITHQFIFSHENFKKANVNWVIFLLQTTKCITT